MGVLMKCLIAVVGMVVLSGCYAKRIDYLQNTIVRLEEKIDLEKRVRINDDNDIISTLGKMIVRTEKEWREASVFALEQMKDLKDMIYRDIDKLKHTAKGGGGR